MGGWEKFQKQNKKRKKKAKGGFHDIYFGIWKGIA